MKPLPLVVIGGAIGGVIGVAVAAAPILPEAAAEQSRHFDNLYYALMIGSGVVFGIVTIILVYSIIRFRARHGELQDGPPIHGVTWLEVTWTAIPALLVTIVAAYSWYILDDNEQGLAATSGSLVVHVDSQQYSFTYSIADLGVENSSSLHLPVNRSIKFVIDTKDVIHSFWVPAWRLQMNATPGQTNYLTVTPTRTGEFDIICAFLCGPGHGSMASSVEGGTLQKITVEDQIAFEAWAAEQKAAAAEASAAETAETTDAATTAEGEG